MKNISVDTYEWTKKLMPIMYKVSSGFPKTNRKLLISLPLTWETLCLIDAMKSYIEIIVVPLSSGKNSSLQPGVFKYLKAWKIHHFLKATKQNRIKALRKKPDVILDCIFTTTEVAMKQGLLDKSAFIIEDTRSGGTKLRKYFEADIFNNPFFIIDENPFKRNYENRMGIGYSVIASLMSLGIFLKGKKLTIIGYGYVGQGLAEFAKRLGAEVAIVEIESSRRTTAMNNNLTVGRLADFLNRTDIFITATGQENVITGKDMLSMKDGVILVNAGADCGEWDQQFLKRHPTRRLSEHIVQFELSVSKKIIELGGGNSLNLVAGIAMSSFLDITFSLAVLIMKQSLENPTLKPGEQKLKSKYSSLLKKEVAAQGITP